MGAVAVRLLIRYWEAVTPETSPALAVFNPRRNAKAGKIRTDAFADLDPARCLDQALQAYETVKTSRPVYYVSCRFEGGWRYEP